ncbi:MAG: spore coat protein CotJB, partial [Aristaeellaceae bacterium]
EERRRNGCDECEERRRNGCDKCEERRCNECRERTECRENNGSCRENCSRGYDSDAYARQQNNGRPCKNRNVGMVSVEMQEIDDIFESETALRAGTLFPELHKPLNGYCPCDRNCGTCAQAAAFAAWEMRLYLNTHPHDKKALCFFRKLCKEAEEENYATTFLTDDCCTSDWSWVENPWPWEYSCRCGDEKPGCGCRNSNG